MTNASSRRATAGYPAAAPRTVLCRACARDCGAAGWVFCEACRSSRSAAQLERRGDYAGGWTLGRNRVGNPEWRRSG